MALVPRDESDSDVAAFRPRPRPWVRALGLNFVLLGLLVGVPYLRGHRRAAESVAGFPAFAACLFGGTARPDGGLSIPVGDREAYATLVLSAPPSWPADCAAALDAVALPEVTFLLPAVKQGEVEVRAAAAQMHEELLALAERRAEDDVVPERPLLALARLQAALSTLLLAVDDTHRGAREAVTLDPALRLSAPSRIPLRVAEGGAMLTRGSASTLRIVTTDASRASLVDVELDLGRVLEALVRRPRAARMTTADGAHAFLLFVTSEATCATDEAAGCANRLMGIARIDPTVERPEAEVWMRAHPRGRADRSVRIDGDVAWVVARTLAGGAELRAFALEWPGGAPTPAADGEPAGEHDGDGPAAAAPAPAAAAAADDDDDETESAARPSVRALLATDLGDVDVLLGPSSARLLRGRELYEIALAAPVAPVAPVAAVAEAGSVAARELPTPFPPEQLVATLAIDATRIWSCDGWTVAAGADVVDIVAPGGVAQWVWRATPRPPLSGPSPEEEPVALACDEAGLAVAVVDASRALAVALCTAADGCAYFAPEAGVIDGAAVALDGSSARVATWRDGGAIFVHALGRATGHDDDTPASDAGIVAACWERGRGFCGPARFVPGAARTLLLARDGTDALVLTRGGDGWQPLPGLGAALPAPAAP